MANGKSGNFRHGFARRCQHRHFARLAPGADRHPVEPRGHAIRRPPAAGVPGRRHAGGRGRSRRHQVRRRRHRLCGGVDCAGADPVRRRAAHPLCHLPQRAGAVGRLGDGRRAADRNADRRGRDVPARHELGRGPAGRCGGGLDRRRSGVLSHPRRRSAPAHQGGRDARGGVRQQRSDRGAADRSAGRVPHPRSGVVVACCRGVCPAGRARRRARPAGRPGHGLRTEPPHPCAGTARAIRRRDRDRDLRPRLGGGGLGLSGGLPGGPGGRKPSDACP